METLDFISPVRSVISVVKQNLCSCNRARVFLRELNQQLQPLARVAAINRVRGERHGLADVIRMTGRDQGGSGVQHHHVATGRAFAVENARMIAAFSLASPPAILSSDARFKPNSSGATS